MTEVDENTSGLRSEQSLSGAFEEVLGSYLDARQSADRVDSSLAVWKLFEQIERLFEEALPNDQYPHIDVDSSVGMPGGEMTHTPWIAFLDDRETDTTQSGTYVVYLFRGDMSGVYLTYSQGVTRPTKLYGRSTGGALVQNRAERIRRRSPGLREANFQLDGEVDLAAQTDMAEDYEKSAIAHKLYEADKIPSDETLLSDLETLLQSYDRYLSQREEKQFPEINREKLDAAVENVIRPAIEGRGDLSENGKEHYQHGKIIPKATPKLTPESLASNPREAVLDALDADVNLLHHTYQRDFAEEFFRQADPTQIREEVSHLLYGSDDLTARVRRFREWGSERKTEEGKTAALRSTVASYLLCLSDPQEFAFCKTQKAYRPAAQVLLGEEEIPSDADERVAHARDFYKEVLSIFEEEYDLPFFDLMHVHIAFFVTQNAGGEEWGEGPLNSEEDFKTEFGETVRRDDPNVYKVATGEDGTRWDDFKEGGFLCVGWDEVGDLRQYGSEQDFREAFYEQYLDGLYEGVKRKASEKAGELWSLMEMKPGDRIVANEGESKVLGVGTVSEPGYEWKPEREEFGHVVHVDWDTSYRQSIESQGHWRFKTIKQLTPGFIDEHLETAPEPYSIEKATDGLFYKLGDFETWLRRLRKKKNLILQGPPGVGKTFVSKRLAYALMGERDEDRTHMVQLHQSYTYEDFIRGYRPTKEEGFRLKDGVFFKFCEQAKEDTGRDYVFIIDEINRGNLSKVFGELMMLIEPDKRGPGHAIQLSNRREEGDIYGNRFYVPENLYLIGMMNTADRSLAMVDYALRRRFAFVDMQPRFHDERYKAHLRKQGASEEMIEKIVSRLRALNEEIGKDDSLGEGFRIGHSYFCPGEKETPDDTWYREVVTREIEPLLKEYWFDASETAENHISDLKGDGNE